MIQPVLLQHYDKTKSIVDLLSEQPNSDLDAFDFSTVHSNCFTFSREDTDFDTDSSLTHVVIQPDDLYQVTVTFSPKADAVSSTLLLIRNNLTVFDYVVLRGRGVQGVFSIDGIQPNSDPLVFEFTQTMMERCYGERASVFINPLDHPNREVEVETNRVQHIGSPTPIPMVDGVGEHTGNCNG